MSELASNVRQARKALGVSQAQLAKMLGLGAAARVYEFEAGKRNPSASVMLLLRAYAEKRLPPDWPDMA